MSDALRRRRRAADRTVPVRRRLATLESQLPYSYGEEDERPLPDAATTGKIVGLLFDMLDRDRERFGAFVRARWPEISDEDLEALTDGAAREADARSELEVFRGLRRQGSEPLNLDCRERVGNWAETQVPNCFLGRSSFGSSSSAATWWSSRN